MVSTKKAILCFFSQILLHKKERKNEHPLLQHNTTSEGDTINRKFQNALDSLLPDVMKI